MADYRAEVGRRLREMREARDLSQEDLAHELGVTAKTLSRWENGRRWPYVANWARIKDYFGKDPREGIESPGPLGLKNGTPDVAPRAMQEQLSSIDRRVLSNTERLDMIERNLATLVGLLTGDPEAHGDLGAQIIRTVERGLTRQAREALRPPTPHRTGRLPGSRAVGDANARP